jgi:hypothetical protein
MIVETLVFGLAELRNDPVLRAMMDPSRLDGSVTTRITKRPGIEWGAISKRLNSHSIRKSLLSALIAYPLWITARDVAAFGLLLAQEGRWGNGQVISGERILLRWRGLRSRNGAYFPTGLGRGLRRRRASEFGRLTAHRVLPGRAVGYARAGAT